MMRGCSRPSPLQYLVAAVEHVRTLPAARDASLRPADILERSRLMLILLGFEARSRSFRGMVPTDAHDARLCGPLSTRDTGAVPADAHDVWLWDPISVSYTADA